MEDLKKNKLFWVIIGLAALNLAFFVGGKFIINKTADRVIEKLQKDYSPSPYGPGIDPDKVDPDTLAKQRVSFQIQKSLDQGWKKEWETNRGFNP